MVWLEPCPHLPEADPSLSAVSIRGSGADRGASFYRLALEVSQSLWRRGLPAQAILMLNRALSADLRGEEPVLHEFPPPYRALRWILEHLQRVAPGFYEYVSEWLKGRLARRADHRTVARGQK